MSLRNLMLATLVILVLGIGFSGLAYAEAPKLPPPHKKPLPVPKATLMSEQAVLNGSDMIIPLGRTPPKLPPPHKRPLPIPKTMLGVGQTGDASQMGRLPPKLPPPPKRPLPIK